MKRDNRNSRTMNVREQTKCRFCRSTADYVDYKDIDTLQRLLTNRGKIYSRKRSGNCAGCQRKVKKAIKRARYMALLPFTA
ncbi:MAG: 30S ribosomal protein S18 [Planctomycetota bacterium]